MNATSSNKKGDRWPLHMCNQPDVFNTSLSHQTKCRKAFVFQHKKSGELCLWGAAAVTNHHLTGVDCCVWGRVYVEFVSWAVRSAFRGTLPTRGWLHRGARVLEPPKNEASLVVCHRFFFQRRTASPPKLPCFTLDSQSAALVASYMATLRHAVWEETFQERYLFEQTSWYLCSCDSCNTFINDEFLHLLGMAFK